MMFSNISKDDIDVFLRYELFKNKVNNFIFILGDLRLLKALLLNKVYTLQT